MFGRKKKCSTSRFVERAVELDTSHLFTHLPLTAAISKISTSSMLPPEEQRCAYATGVIHGSDGDGQPLLPVKIEFAFDGANKKAARGEIWTLNEERASCRARIVVLDRGAHFFSVVQKAAEHAVMSGNQFLHIVFQRMREKPYDLSTDHLESKANQERLSALIRRIDSGEKDAKMPLLEFDKIWIEDAIYMRAPSWSHTWDNDIIDRPIYHSSDTAKWRSRPWRQ